MFLSRLDPNASPTPAIEDAPRINHKPGACGLDDRLNDVGPLGKVTMRAAGGAADAGAYRRTGVRTGTGLGVWVSCAAQWEE